MAPTEPLTSDGRGPDGLYPKSDYEKMGMQNANLYIVYSLMMFVLGSPGFITAAVNLFVMPSPALLQKVALLKTYDLAPIYFLPVVINLVMTTINANLGTARRPTRVNVPDQHVYRVYGGSADASLVMMHDDGAFGAFNRAQRALANFEEILPMLIMHVVLGAFIFPWTVLTCTVLLGATRIKGSVDYTAERSKRLTGNMLSMVILNGIQMANLAVGIAATLPS